MKIPIPALLVAVLLCALPSHLEAKKKQPKIGNTTENLLRPPRVYNMTMSPDGKYAASVAPIGEDGDRGLVIFDLDTMKIHRSFKWRAKDIDSVTWTTNEDVAFHLSKWGAYVEGIFSVNVNRKEIYPLIANDAVVSWADPMREDKDAWIWIRDSFRAKPGLARLRATGNAKIRSGPGETETAPTSSNPLISNRIYNPPGDIFWWGFDHEHQPRIVLRFHQDKLEYIHRYTKEEDWKPLKLDPERWDIELFGAEKNTLFVSGYNGEKTKGLYTYDIESESIGELLFRDDYYDFSDTARYLYYGKQVVGFRYLRDTMTFVWLHDELESIQRMVDSAIPNRVNIIYNSSTDFSRHLVYSYSDSVPPEYSILDLRAKTLNQISKTAPWLDYEKLSPTQVFHYKTKDGLRLEGYLTLPKGKKKGPYPTICLIHGGPWVRDSGGYDDETQFFTSNGYAVVRVNYRGSTGYGKEISFDPQYHFRKMQDDITQAAKLMVKQGIADPDRLAIMGASFGGYSALCGATFEPDLYSCAITNMGVFDWEEMIKSRKRQDHHYSHHKLKEELGDPKENQDRFEEISPIYHIDKVKIPIFVIHGKDDSNVSIRQSKKLKTELQKHEVEHEVLFIGDEGHNIFSLKKRVKTYERVLAFLNKHMS
ncbi:alpha/beta hydrolase family protein [Pelagicoccus mobilis]|uniref:S9 family peptidase n=1 Tax=Pelagicoccus mobilis TaxID=415221 RepID=A0A934VSE1_9BACT|nr:prolyl oligopeptidase family serine peptidase [Pelagicoccus mobilis]MBK1878573.1 S9 family peptidase [Pelagicoccus mobilis]